MTDQAVQEQIEQILRLDKQSITHNIGGMAAYGARFDLQREYFIGLPPEEERSYEEAVLAICRMPERTAGCSVWVEGGSDWQYYMSNPPVANVELPVTEPLPQFRF